MYSTALNQEKYHCALTATSVLSSAWPEGPSRIDYMMISSHQGFIRLNACTLLGHLHGSMTQQEQLLATSPGPYCSCTMQKPLGMCQRSCRYPSYTLHTRLT